jgi:hypothetical protein
MIMNKPAKYSIPAIIEPDYDEAPRRKHQRLKKICAIQHQSKYYPIPCPPSLFSCLLDAANLVQSSIPNTIIIIKNQRPKVKDCIETESSSNGTKRKRASTSPAQNNTVPLVKRRPLLFCAARKTPSSTSSILPLGKPLAAPPNLPRLAAGRAIPKLFLQ